MRIFLAGATGAVGRRLVPLLIGGGHDVTGTTRSAEAARKLEAAGVHPAIVDVYDAEALQRAAVAARPEAVIHQLTDLPQAFDEKELAASYPRNARIRTEGTRNLIAAAKQPEPGASSCKASRSPMRRDPSRMSRTIRSIFLTGRGW